MIMSSLGGPAYTATSSDNTAPFSLGGEVAANKASEAGEESAAFSHGMEFWEEILRLLLEGDTKEGMRQLTMLSERL